MNPFISGSSVSFAKRHAMKELKETSLERSDTRSVLMKFVDRFVRSKQLFEVKSNVTRISLSARSALSQRVTNASLKTRIIADLWLAKSRWLRRRLSACPFTTSVNSKSSALSTLSTTCFKTQKRSTKQHWIKYVTGKSRKRCFRYLRLRIVLISHCEVFISGLDIRGRLQVLIEAFQSAEDETLLLFPRRETESLRLWNSMIS